MSRKLICFASSDLQEFYSCFDSTFTLIENSVLKFTKFPKRIVEQIVIVFCFVVRANLANYIIYKLNKN